MSAALIPCPYIPESILHFSPNAENCDASVGVLKSIFGQPIDVLTGVGNPSIEPVHSLITLFIGHFDYAMLAFFPIIFGYIVVVGVINTQTEGRFGGRQMGTWWFPFRTMLPAGLLIPYKGGFCALQFLIMYSVLAGSNMASFVWHYSVKDINMGYLPTTPQALKTGIANDVGEIFVYDAVKSILDRKGLVATITAKGGTAAVAGSPYETQVKKKLNAVCSASASDVTACQKAVSDMFNGNITAITYPAGAGPNSSTAFNQNNTYTQYQIGYGSDFLKFDGRYSASGTYTFNFDAPLNPQKPNPSGTVDTQDIVKLLNGEQAKGEGPGPNIIDTVVAENGDPSLACADGSKCGFNSLINSVMDSMIKANPPKQTANDIVVQGTGQTCQNICRKNGSLLPYPNWDGSASTCPATGYHMQTDHQCYKINESTDTSAGHVVPIPGQYLSNSWWYGSRVYLQLNRQMADNIHQMAEDVKQFEITPQEVIALAQFTPTGTSPTGLNTYANLTQIIYGAHGLTETSNVPLFGKTKASSLISLTQSAATRNSAFAWPKWSNMICSYKPDLPAGLTAANCTQKLESAQNPSVGGAQVVLGSAQANEKGFTLVQTGADPAFYNLLANMPAQYQPPIGVLIKLQKAKLITLDHFKSYVENIVRVLAMNHIYPGSEVAPTGVSDQGEVNPVNYWIGSMFNRMLGVNVPGIGGNAQTGGLFKDIYSLGNTDTSTMSNVLSGSFNTLAHAQRIGLEMINTVTLSLQTVYTAFKSKMSAFRAHDRKIAEIGGGSALGSEVVLGGIGVPFSGSISTAVAVAAQTVLQFTLADQMHQIAEDLMWLPLLGVVVTSLFTAGISFAVLLPLVPYILFWAGQIAWLLAVIEAMIAAPVVLLGLMTPGGHEHWGHIVPGFRMWISLVFRPVLMVLGLLVGLVLTFIVIHFSSQGFQLIANQIIAFAGSGENYGTTTLAQQTYANNVSLTQGIIASILLTTFCGFMVLAFNKCFSAIYVIPEKVMQWVGGTADKAGEQDLQQMTSAMNQTSGQVAQAGNSALDKGTGAESQFTQAQGSADGQGLSGGVQVAHQVTRESVGMRGKGGAEGEAKGMES